MIAILIVLILLTILVATESGQGDDRGSHDGGEG